MMDYGTALNIAMNVPSGTPPYYAAEAICRMRAVDPWGMSPLGPPNWQAIIIEQLTARCIIEELWPKP